MDLHEIILADAIESAIKAERENIILKRCIVVLASGIIALIILLWCK